MDVICFEDLDEFGRDLDDPVAELEQDIIHMLLESYRTNVSDFSRSIGLEDALSSGNTLGLAHRIETKLTDDPRIDAAKVSITSIDAVTLKIDLLVQADGQELGISLTYDAAGNLVRL